LGEFAALATALFWTITVLCFEYAGKRVGTRSLNLIRLSFGFIFLSLFTWITRGRILPLDAPPSLWFWLTASGFVGFVVGDLLLFQAFIEIGGRISMLIYSAVPPLSAVLGWIFLRERISLQGFVGMVITLSGIALVILEKDSAEGDSDATRTQFRHPLRGVLLAFGGALGQAAGLILSKHGAPSFNPFAATQIRCLAGIVGFTLVVLATRHGSQLIAAFRDRKALRIILLGSFFGPFLGVSLSLLAIQHTSTGVASTIMALVPVLVIWPSHILFHEPIRFREVVGALIAVAGTVLLFFH